MFDRTLVGDGWIHKARPGRPHTSIQPASLDIPMSFPIELAECIIDASCSHPPTLAACSLVCKQWLPRSRHHLFSSLDLSADWNPEPNAVTEFIKIIDTPNSTLIPYVTGVVLSKRSWGMTPVHKILTILAVLGSVQVFCTLIARHTSPCIFRSFPPPSPISRCICTPTCQCPCSSITSVRSPSWNRSILVAPRDIRPACHHYPESRRRGSTH
ncbi:hypothetical protein B0H13DRAFT_154564 [Mycena leptocephala]|nr:hypothetical protein B0H13DRAFT_154564 [Mycena leptocephala]